MSSGGAGAARQGRAKEQGGALRGRDSGAGAGTSAEECNGGAGEDGRRRVARARGATVYGFGRKKPAVGV